MGSGNEGRGLESLQYAAGFECHKKRSMCYRESKDGSQPRFEGHITGPECDSFRDAVSYESEARTE